MRHDPIDPAACSGAKCSPVAVMEAMAHEVSCLLDALERQSRAAIAAAEAELETLEVREAGDLEDNSARDAAMTLASELLARERKELEEIAVARRRVSTRTFSTCEACHGVIPLFRLRALPTTRVCVKCQARTEMEEAAAR